MAKKKASQAQIDRQNAWVSQAKDRVLVVMPKGMKQDIVLSATKNGDSVNSFILRAIEEEIKRQERRRYIYSMKPFCSVPTEGLIENDGSALTYNRRLSNDDMQKYGLEFIQEVEV